MFTDKERVLANEASLTASLLGNGLNALRKADIYNKGLYYQAFFSLPIGIERLLKIILITQYRCAHEGDFPVDLDLKKIGHDLNKLCQRAGVPFEEGSLHERIVSFLNEFAVKSRYYNIDSMLDKKIQYYDPLCQWALIAQDILGTTKRRRTMGNKRELAAMMDSISVIRFHDLQGNEINQAMGLLDELENRTAVQQYSVQYMFEIIRKLVAEVRRLERVRYMMPVLTEFFTLYGPGLTPSEIRKKRDWLRLY